MQSVEIKDSLVLDESLLYHFGWLRCHEAQSQLSLTGWLMSDVQRDPTQQEPRGTPALLNSPSMVSQWRVKCDRSPRPMSTGFGGRWHSKVPRRVPISTSRANCALYTDTSTRRPRRPTTPGPSPEESPPSTNTGQETGIRSMLSCSEIR